MLVEIDNKPIEAVRVLKKYRGQKIGKWMMNAAELSANYMESSPRRRGSRIKLLS